MRKKMVAITCDGDGCGKLAEIEDEGRMPEGWLQVRIPNDDGRLPPSGFDLCSLKCVGKWAKGRAEVLSGSASNGTAYAKKPCPICEQLIAPQGFSQHFHTQHLGEDFITAKEMFAEAEVVGGVNA